MQVTKFIFLLSLLVIRAPVYILLEAVRPDYVWRLNSYLASHCKLSFNISILCPPDLHVLFCFV